MKLLHLADLHLGKQMNDVSLLADQEAVLLGQVVPIARRENVDAVLIAGDVYQRATPQAEAVALFRGKGETYKAEIIDGIDADTGSLSSAATTIRRSGSRTFPRW